MEKYYPQDILELIINKLLTTKESVYFLVLNSAVHVSTNWPLY